MISFDKLLKELNVIYIKIYGHGSPGISCGFKPSLKPYIETVKQNIKSHQISNNKLKHEWCGVKKDMNSRLANITKKEIQFDIAKINNILHIKAYLLTDVVNINDYLDYHHVITELNCVPLKAAILGVQPYKQQLSYLVTYLSKNGIDVITGLKDGIEVTPFDKSVGQSVYYLYDTNIFKRNTLKVAKIANKMNEKYNSSYNK